MCIYNHSFGPKREIISAPKCTALLLPNLNSFLIKLYLPEKAPGKCHS